MDLGFSSVVLTGAQFGYRRYGIRGALLFGGIVGGIYLLVERRLRAE
jgi:hypothetical protein